MAMIGFIGLGVMGRPMAGNLIRGGHTLFLQSRSGVPEDLLRQGGIPCDSPRKVTQNSDIIITMLPDTPDVETVLFGPDGIADALTPGKTVVDMSSISPIQTREFAIRINHLGCDYADAPVSGGEVGAMDAPLTIMGGATAKPVRSRIRSLLHSRSRRLVRRSYLLLRPGLTPPRFANP